MRADYIHDFFHFWSSRKWEVPYLTKKRCLPLFPLKALYGYVVRINPFIPCIRYKRAETVREEKSGQTETSAASKKKRRGSGSQAVNSGEGRDRRKIGYQIDRKRIIVFLQGLVIHEPSFLYEIRPKERVALAEKSKLAH